jgi:hypothetical protein
MPPPLLLQLLEFIIMVPPILLGIEEQHVLIDY